MEIRKKIVKLKNVTQIPLYDSFISRDGDKLITRDGDYLTWIRIESAYATDVTYDGAAYSFVEHYVLSNGTEASARKTYNRFAPSVSITSAPVSEVITANPTSWSSSIASTVDIGESLYESYDGWNMYFEEYDIAADYVNEGNSYTITARAEVASRMVYRDQYLTVNFTASTPAFNTSVLQEYNTTTQTYDTNFIVGAVSGSLTASDSHYVAVYNTTAISDFPSEWGKITNVQHTVTPSEDRTSWVYIVALSFENRFLPIRVYRDGVVVVDTNCSTAYQANLNCAVYASSYEGTWIPSIAENASSSMRWKNKNGEGRRALDYITATAMGWNDGHNTVQNFATSSTISNGTLTIKLWGNTIASYKVLP